MKQINPMVMHLVGIVLFSALFKEMGFIMFTSCLGLYHNFHRLRSGWKFDTPNTINPIWFTKRDANIRKFYIVGIVDAFVVIGGLFLLGWKYAIYAYLALWWTVFIADQVVAYFYIRRFNRQRRFTA